MKIFKKMKKGFTLVELVVVIAVIAILAAVSVGAYFGVTESANRSKLEQEGKQVHTAIQTISLAGSEHSSLTSNGLEISNPGNFRLALEESLGKEVALTDELDTKDSAKPTIYFTDVEIQSALGDKTYKTFEYHLPEISGKKTQVDVVTGEVKVEETSAAGEELPEVLPTVTTIVEALTAPVDSPAVLSGTVYGLYAGGENSFYLVDENENQILVFSPKTPATVGDIVTVNGKIGQYNKVNQVAAGATVEITGHDTSYDEILPVTSIEEALNSPDGTKVELTGEFVSKNDKYSDETKTSGYIKDENGDQIYVFEMAEVVALHDLITVSGNLTTYQSQKQIGSGATVVKNGTAEHKYTDATCESPATCEVCGATTGSAAGHKDENSDGNCDICLNPIDTALETILIKDYAGTNSWVNGTKYLTIEGEHFTVSTTSTSNSGKYYTDGNEWRIYQSESSEITISAETGYKIVKASVSYNVKNTGILTLNSSNIESGSEVSVNANSVTFGVGNTTANTTNGQVKITAVSVWYATDNETPVEPPVEPPVEEKINVYFQNNWLWTDVCLYYWVGEDDNTWPGEAMTLFGNDGTYDIYSFEIPANVTGVIINGIKDDGSGTRDQTPNITSGIVEGICYYMKWEDGNAVGHEDISVMLPEEPETPVDPEPTPDPEEPKTPVTVTKTIEQLNTSYDWLSGSVGYYSYEFTLDENIKISVTKGRLWDNGKDLRLYASQNSTFVISCIGNFTIDTVKLAFSGTCSNITNNANKTVDASSFSLSINSGQTIKMTSVTVTYTAN